MKDGKPRRHLPVAAVCLAAVTCVAAITVSASLAGTLKGESATAFQINSAHDGNMAFSGGFKTPLHELWSVGLPGFASYPVIARKRAFLVVQDASNYSLTLYALSLRKGTTLWKVPLSGTFWAAPAYDKDTVFVFQHTGELDAFDPATGNALWTQQLGTSDNSAPAAKKGQLFVDGYTGIGYSLFSIDEATGSVQWTASDLAGQSTPAIGNGGVYSCDASKFSLTDGSRLWHYDYGCSSIGNAPVLADKRVYVRDTADHRNVVLDSATGSALATFGGGPPPAFFRDSSGAEFGVTLTDEQLFCFSVKTGNVIWSFAGDGQLSSAPLVVNGEVIAGSWSGELYVLNGQDGSTLWSTKLAQTIRNPDEWNQEWPLTGLAAGDAVLVVPASDSVVAFAPKK